MSLWEVLREVGPPDGAAGSGGGRRVAVHDSCTARYQTSVQTAVRDLLTTCGYTVDELEMSHERTECCGFGGLMLYANPEMGDVVARRRVRESDADFVAYCAMCRDRFAAKGKPTAHILDLLFGDDFDARARRRGPVLTQRAGQRAALKQRLLAGAWGERRPAPDWRGTPARIPRGRAPPGRPLHPAGGSPAGRHAERGDRPPLRGGRHRPAVGDALLGPVTYWVEYEPEGDRFRVHTAYSHRMEVKPPPWPPADEHEHATAVTGAARSATTRSSRGRSRCRTWSPGFPVKLLACLEHGMVLITEELATGRMLEAELALEDK